MYKMHNELKAVVYRQAPNTTAILAQDTNNWHVEMAQGVNLNARRYGTRCEQMARRDGTRCNNMHVEMAHMFEENAFRYEHTALDGCPTGQPQEGTTQPV